MRRNVMQVTHDLAVGGLQQVVVNLCRHIDRSVFDVSVVCLRDLGSISGQVKKLGIEVSLISQLKKIDYFAFLKLACIMKKKKIDIVHTHNTQPFIDGTLAALLAGVKTIVHTDHSRVFPDRRRYMFAERVMSYFAYKVVGVSDAVVRNLIQYEKISRAKMLIIPNGINVADHEMNIDDIGKRRDLGLDDTSPILGIASRLCKVKGLTYLLKAMCDIRVVYKNAKLLIIGDGPEKYELEKEARALNLHDQVLFLGERTDVQQLLKVLNIFVLPSISEGMPICLLEAMASGCPVIASRVGGVPEMIENGKTGILVEPANVSALANAILSLLGNEPMRRSMSIEGRRVVRERFCALKMTKAYEQLYLRKYLPASADEFLMSSTCS